MDSAIRIRARQRQPRNEAGSKPFKTVWSGLLLLGFVFGFAKMACAQPQITAVQTDARVDVYIDGRFFTSYITSPDEKYPYFFPVNGPSGASVTSKRNSDYPHHSSLFFGADHVNGGNYWQEGTDRGQIVSVQTLIERNGGEHLIIRDECLWVRPGAASPLKDTREIVISSPEETIYQIDFTITLHPLQDVVIQKTNHSLFSARMDPDLSVVNGGTLVNAEGDTSEEGTFGKTSGWVSYYGSRGQTGNVEGLTMMQHPSNAWYPAPWFTRNYGFISPTPLYWPEDEDAGTKLAKGEEVTLRYRVLVHTGDHLEAGIAARFEEYITN